MTILETTGALSMQIQSYATLVRCHFARSSMIARAGLVESFEKIFARCDSIRLAMLDDNESGASGQLGSW